MRPCFSTNNKGFSEQGVTWCSGGLWPPAECSGLCGFPHPANTTWGCWCQYHLMLPSLEILPWSKAILQFTRGGGVVFLCLWEKRCSPPPPLAQYLMVGEYCNVTWYALKWKLLSKGKNNRKFSVLKLIMICIKFCASKNISELSLKSTAFPLFFQACLFLALSQWLSHLSPCLPPLLWL